METREIFRPSHSTFSGCTAEEDERSSKPASVLSSSPADKLQAKEMLQEAEVRRQSPGVIAKLMGLEGIPSHSQQTSGRSRRRQVVDHHTKRKVEKAEKSGYISNRGSSRRSSKGEEEFKDVFEVTDWSKLRSCDYVLPMTAETDIDEPEMAFIGQRFSDAKRLSMHDKRQDSKGFDDAVKVLHSNKDLLPKVLQQPDPFFANHVSDIWEPTFVSHWSKNASVRNPVVARGCETSNPCSKSSSETIPPKRGRSLKNFPNCVPSQTPIALDDSSYKSTKGGSLYSFPTRIVVLKPHLGIGDYTPETNLSPSGQFLFLDFDIPSEFSSGKSLETMSVHGKRNTDQSEKSKSIPREVSRRANGRYANVSSISVPSFRHEVNSEDESSSNISLDEFAYDSDGEAKGRLSERWKLARQPRNSGEYCKGRTLGEMLAIPDRLVRHTDLHKIGQQGSKKVSATSVEPSGISSRDGWKHVVSGKFSRSRSLPGSSTLIRSDVPEFPRTCRGRHASCEFVEIISREATRWDNHSLMKGNTKALDRLATGSLRYSCSELNSPRFRSGNCSDVSSISESTCGKIAIRPKEIIQSPWVAGEEETRAKPSPSHHSEASLQQLDSSGGLDELLSKELPGVIPENCRRAARDSIPEPDSSTVSKDADQPCPVSVLEAAFADDFPYGPEYFESLSTDLHGLRVQLELLKLESRAYIEGSGFMPSCDNANGELSQLLEGRAFCKPPINWEFSYIEDMLRASGFRDCDPENFITKWHSPDYPAGPSVFEELEKIYESHSSSVSERKLLFDLINLSIPEIYRPLMDPHPWLRPVALMFHSNWRKNPLQEILMRLVTSHKKDGKEGHDKSLISDSEWLYSGGNTDIIGKVLSNLLELELMDELLCSYAM